MGGSWWIEVIFLAMLAGFIALRLVSVLGRRTGHESPARSELYRSATAEVSPAPSTTDGRARVVPALPDGLPDEAIGGLTAIHSLDPVFDTTRFLNGAKSAYAMILGAFWAGDISEVEQFMSDEVAEQFRRSITDRVNVGSSYGHQMKMIDDARIAGAHLDGSMAEVVVRFDSVISVAMPGGVDGAGAESAARTMHARDEWTFRRHVTASDPNWLLIATETHDE